MYIAYFTAPQINYSKSSSLNRCCPLVTTDCNTIDMLIRRFYYYGSFFKGFHFAFRRILHNFRKIG